MTLIEGSVEDVGMTPMTGVLTVRTARFRPSGEVLYAPEAIPFPIVNGQVTAELAPGPAVLTVKVGSHAQDRFEVVIPDQVSITLADLIETVFSWEPEQINKFITERKASEAAATAAGLSAAAAMAAKDRAILEHEHVHLDAAHVDAVAAQIPVLLEQANVFAQDQVPPFLQDAVLKATYAPVGDYADADMVADLTAGKLDKSEAAATYATAAQVSGMVEPLVPPLVAQAIAADPAPAQAAAVAVDSYIATKGRATATVDGLMPATDKALLTSAFEKSTNMVDLGVLARGFVLPAGPGAPTVNAGYGITPHLPLAAGQTFAVRGILRVHYYDAAGTYVTFHSYTTQVYEPAGETMTAPANTASVRFSVQNTREAIAQANLGATLAPYQLGHPPRVAQSYLPEMPDVDVIVEPSTDAGNLLRKGTDGSLLLPAITPAATTFFTLSTNMYDKGTAAPSSKLNLTTGAVESQILLSVSDWIPVVAGQVYTVTGHGASASAIRVGYYKAGKVFHATALLTQGSAPSQFTPPATVAFVRLVVHDDARNAVQMNAGTTALPYEPAGRVALKSEYLPYVPPAETKVSRPRPILDTDVSQPYLTHVTQPDLNSVINTTTVAKVYEMWDALVTAHPGYVTRTHMGDDAWGFPIYRYDLKPVPIPNVGGQPIAEARHPAPLHRVLIANSSHGFERQPVWTTHRLAKAMCEDWATSPAMAALRFNTHLTVVPIACPTGWTDGTRINRNGVDPARNFPTGWVQGTQGTPTYGGVSPASELETQYMLALLDEAGPTAVAAIDFHTYLGIAGTQEQFLWNCPATPATTAIAMGLMRRMERIWKVSQPGAFSPDPQVQTAGGVGALPTGGFAYEAAHRGIPVACTFEHCERVWVGGVPGTIRTSQAATMGYEAWTNFLLMVLQNWNADL